MCGINGIVSFEKCDEAVLKKEIQLMVKATEHRGPDEQEVCLIDQAAFALNRLAIVAPCEHAGVQKLHSRYYALFNGEIVNYKSLRSDFSDGLKYGPSDTAVILPLYEKYGVSFIKKCAGMFTISIYDRQKNELHLWRDPLGIKPLYYYKDNARVIFSSEVKAIYEALSTKPLLSIAAIDHILRYRFHPGRSTVFPSIKRVLPGEHIVFTDSKEIHERYWTLSDNVEKNENVSVDEHRELLVSIVKEQARADVAGGFFVSGGIDSSLITSIALRPASPYTEPISLTFFPHHAHDESFGKILEKSLRKKFEWVRVTDELARNTLEETVMFMDEPLENPIHIGTYLMSKRAREMGLKSVLTGDGSDEFFLGYERHVCWFTKSKKEAQSEYPRWLWTATPDEAHELYLPWVQEHIKPMPTFKNINEVLRFERWERLQEYHCSRLDRMTMAWGVEAKVPFLDHRLVEYSLKVPLKKLFGKTGKEWLQDIARPYLPQEIIRRPKVHFPSLPNEWLSGKGVDWMSSILLDRGAKVAVFLNKKTLEKYIQQHKSGEIKHGRLLWALVSLELWLDRYPFSHF